MNGIGASSAAPLKVISPHKPHIDANPIGTTVPMMSGANAPVKATITQKMRIKFRG
jgi:hypothetical protein